MKTHIAVILWVLGVFVAMLGSTALDAWFKRQEQAKQYEAVINDILANTCPNPACGPSCCGDKCKCGPDCDCNLVEEVQEQLGPKDQVVAAKPKLIMHSIPGCGPCEQDKRVVCQWTATWDVEIVTDVPEPGRSYPWYEVEELDGTRFQFTDRISAQAVERGRNVVRSNRR